MKKHLTIILILLTLFSCQQKETQVAVDQDRVKAPKVVDLQKPVKQACTKEAKICADGSSVGRNPKFNCKFDDCPKKASKPTAKMCTADVKQCPDGSYVSRDHYNNCRFKECPTSKKPKKE